MVDRPLGSRYVLGEMLGRGAMGEVFRGSVRESGAAVAVKILKPELVSDPEVAARFFRERSILMSVDHPNVVRVSDLVVEGETLGIVMDLVEGPDLRRWLRERGTVSAGAAVGLVRQLLAGLTAVHAAGIVHRDVKPENVLVDAAGGEPRVRLTDFGVARLSYGGSLTRLSSLIGTPEYMAPEVAAQDTAGPAADVYAAGIVLYELVASRTPFAGSHPMAVLRRHLECPPPPVPGLAPPLQAQLDALLAKDPASRPSAAGAAAALAPLEEALAGVAALPPMPEPSPDTWAQPAAGPDAATIPGTGTGTRHGTILRHRDRATTTAATSNAAVSPASRPRWRSRPAVIALPAAVVLLAAAAAVVLARGHGTPPATADHTRIGGKHGTPTTKTSDASALTQPSAYSASPTAIISGSNQAATGITVSTSALQSDPDGAAVVATMTAYFGGINSKNYAQAWEVLNSALEAANPFSSFSRQLSTTSDSNVMIRHIQHERNGVVLITVTFRSHQARQYGPQPGETCTDWSLNYWLTPLPAAQGSASVTPYLIGKVAPVGAGQVSC